jgi:hypothetical protein
VRGAPGCTWSLVGHGDWLAVSGASGAGDGAIALTAAPNPSAGPREATFTFGARTVTIFQDGTARLVHPRLWLDPASVEGLRARAVQANPAYRALRAALDHAIADYDARFAKGAWGDNGGVTFSADVSEAYAELFAFASLLARQPRERDDLAARARALLMHVVDRAVLGPAPGVPFRDPGFACFDRARWWGEGFGLTADWIHASLDAEDRAKLRTVFLRWAGECSKSGAAPWLVKESGPSLRAAANNYYLGHLRNLALTSLCLDPADDPPVDPGRPADEPGNTLRAYQRDVTDVWLRRVRTLFVGGDASGGLPAEGFLYGTSLAFLHEALEALTTAGVEAPDVVALRDDRYWDDLVVGFAHSLSPAPRFLPGLEYLGAVHTFAGYGDAQRVYATGDWITVLGTIGALDERLGEPRRLEALRWLALEALPGGAAKLASRASDVWANGNALHAIRYFELFDPAAPAPKDPRPALPLAFVSRPLGRLLARTDWGPNASLFSYLCAWSSIPHQVASCGQIGMYRKGEWLTSERSGYSQNGVNSTTDYKNALSIENDHLGTPPLEWFEAETNRRGSQYGQGLSAGDPAVRTSAGERYAFAEADATPLYNRVAPRGSATDVVHASRAVVWLAPDRLVVYDRAATKSEGRFKRWNLMLPSMPAIDGTLATAASPRGQRLFVRTLLPVGAALSAAPGEKDAVAEGETMAFRLVVEDPSSPKEVRFLHVLEGADAGAAPPAVELVRSTGGARYEGAIVGAAAVMFPVDFARRGAPFAGVSFRVPERVTAFVVTGLAPEAPYALTRAARDGLVEVSVRPGEGTAADAGGVVVSGVGR